MSDGGKERKELTLPALDAAQTATVQGLLVLALHHTFMAYGSSLGAARIHEMEAFGTSLLLGMKNGDISGLDMSKESAVVETVVALIQAAIPNVKRAG